MFWYLIMNKSQRTLGKKFLTSRGTIRNRLNEYKITKNKYLIKLTRKDSSFKKGHKINLGRKRLDMIGNQFWKGKL